MLDSGQLALTVVVQAAIKRGGIIKVAGLKERYLSLMSIYIDTKTISGLDVIEQDPFAWELPMPS